MREKKKALLNIKEPGLTGFNAVSPLQHLHLSNCHMMQKDRNGFWAKIKSRVLPGKYGLKVKPVDCKCKTLERLKVVPQIPLRILRA